MVGTMRKLPAHPELLPANRRQFLDADDLLPGFCVWCGRTGRPDKHEPAGQKYGASIHLCNRPCHLDNAHGHTGGKTLFFRVDRGSWEGLETEEPTDELTALGMNGWERLTGRWERLRTF